MICKEEGHVITGILRDKTLDNRWIDIFDEDIQI